MIGIVCTMQVVSTTQAQTTPDAIQITPTFQEVELSAEQSEAIVTIEIKNLSNTEQVFALQTATIDQFDSQGNIILTDKPLTSSTFSEAPFLHVKVKQVHIPAQSAVQIPVTVQNSLSLSPGGHYAAIIARLQGNNAANPVVLPAVSTFILVRKTGGEQYHISLQENPITSMWWSTLPTSIDLVVSNQGNTHITPRGIITITDHFGRQISKAAINQNSLYVFPGTQRHIAQELHQMTWAWPVSVLHVTIAGYSEPGDYRFQHSEYVLYIHPVMPSSLILIAIVALLSHRQRRQHRQRHLT